MEWKIGCSGFYYREWKDVFYPKGLTQKNWFKFYCEYFNTIEINSTFYKMPSQQSFEKWHQDSPANFVFTIKTPRLITHYKRLNDCSLLLTDFYLAVSSGLKEKLGCVLFQFPPQFSFSQERLNKLLGLLDPTFRNVVEFRHETWWNEQVFTTLGQHQIIFCGQSYPSHLPDYVVKNNDTVYYRFHGKPILYKSEYPMSTINELIPQVSSSSSDVYVYFNNTWGTGALTNSRQLQSLLRQDL